MHRSFLRRTRASKGFTLLEVLLAIGVSAIVLGGLYTIADGALQMGAEVAGRQERALARDSFVHWCRDSFRSLAPGARVSLSHEESGVGEYRSLLRIDKAPLAFPLGRPRADTAGAVSIGAREQAGGYLTVGGSFPVPNEDGSAGERWLPLLGHVGEFGWRLYSPAPGRWEQFSDGAARPRLVELTLGLDGEPPVRHVFSVPPAVPSAHLLAPKLRDVPGARRRTPGAAALTPSGPGGSP